MEEWPRFLELPASRNTDMYRTGTGLGLGVRQRGSWCSVLLLTDSQNIRRLQQYTCRWVHGRHRLFPRRMPTALAFCVAVKPEDAERIDRQKGCARCNSNNCFHRLCRHMHSYYKSLATPCTTQTKLHTMQSKLRVCKCNKQQAETRLLTLGVE